MKVKQTSRKGLFGTVKLLNKVTWRRSVISPRGISVSKIMPKRSNGQRAQQPKEMFCNTLFSAIAIRQVGAFDSTIWKPLGGIGNLLNRGNMAL